MRFCELLLGLAGATLLARTLGPAGLGAYSLALAIAVAATQFVSCGIPGLAMREISMMHAQGQWSEIRGLLALGLTLISAGGLAVAVLAAVLSSIIDPGDAFIKTDMLPAVALLVPLISLGNLTSSAMQGFKQFLHALMPVMALRPGGFVLFLCAAIFGAPGWLTPERALWLYVAATGASVIVGVFTLVRYMTWARVLGPVHLKSAGRWLWRGLHFLGMSGMQIVFSHVIVLMLGAFASQTAVGLYRIAERGAQLGTIGIEIIIFVMRPRFAELFGGGKLDRLQIVVSHTARFMFASTFGVLIFFLFFGQFLLRELFGPEFEAAYLTLCILTASYCAGNLFGPGVLLLTMTLREGDALRITTAAAALALATSVGLIWMYGAVGAALSLLLARLFVDVAGWIVARRRLGIETAVIPLRAP